MAHTLIWSELSLNDLTSEVIKELPYVGFGTNYTGSWTKKLFKLKWLNSSVEDVKIWLDRSFGDIYLSSEFPKYKSTNYLDLINDLGFDIRITELDNFNVVDLPNAVVATNSNLGTSSIGSTFALFTSAYIDGKKIDDNSLILVKSQNNKSENGLYKILQKQTGTGSTSSRLYINEEVLIAGKIVSVGSSTYYSWLKNYKPFEKASSGSTDIEWVDRTSTYRLANVKAATNSNLQSSGVALTNNSRILDNYSLNLNDRVLVKDQNNNIQNGIYYVSDLYASGKNYIINPNTSSDPKDDFWDIAVFNFSQGKPVNVRITNGDQYGGKYFRLHSTGAYNIIPYSILGEGGEGEDDVTEPDSPPPTDAGGFGSTQQNQWVDGTADYNRYNVTWTYEIAIGSSIGFTTDNGTSPGRFFNVPSNLIDSSQNSIATSIGQSILVNHFKPQYSGIYVVSGVGDSWARSQDFNVGTKFTNQIIKSQNNVTPIGGPYFYMTLPAIGTTNSFNLNLDPIIVGYEYQPWNYAPVSNLITSEIYNFNRVLESQFDNSGIGISQRVLVTGQATTASQNGIYVVSNTALGSTFKIEFSPSYNIINGSIANSTGTGTTYFLYADLDNVSSGSTSVNFVDITSSSNVTANYSTASDKFTSGSYISPDDFSNDITNGSIIFVNSTNKKINGIYDATLGTPQKRIFDYTDGLLNWTSNIFSNIISTYKNGKFTLSPNLRNQIDGILISRNSGSFGDSQYANTKHGNIYVPEINFPSDSTYENYFSNSNLSSFLDDLEIDWKTQDYQNFRVKAIFKTNTLSGFPISSGTAISSKLSSGLLIAENDQVLVYIGNGISSSSNYNGIYRAKLASTGASIFLSKDDDFDTSTQFDSESFVKTSGSPYERPAKVFIENGYFASGSSFAQTIVYMQGVLGYKADQNLLGINSISPLDPNQYNAGSEFYVKNSDVRLSIDYQNLFTFPKLSPIQHVLSGDLTNQDQVNGDILIISRGYELYSTLNNPLIKFYYEIGDRVIYKDSDEDVYGKNLPNSINGIYQISYINRNTFTYYLRKVKQNASIGHLDYAKRLEIHPNFEISDGAFPLVKYAGDGTTYTWSQYNYSDYDIFKIDSNGNKTVFVNGVDYEIFPNTGLLSAFTSFGDLTETLYVYLYQDNGTPRYNQVPKALYNRYHAIDQVLTDKYFANSSVAKTSGTYSADKTYFQITNLVGNANTSQNLFNTDRKHWYIEYDSNKNYYVDLKNVLTNDNTNDYFVSTRLSSEGYYFRTGSGFSALFYDNNFINPGTGRTIGLFYGNVYLQKINNVGNGFTIQNWFSSLGLTTNDNILILNNNISSIAETAQSTYYNDENILIKKLRSGKKDQKIYKFIKSGYTPVSLSFNSNLTDPITPLYVTSGISTYFLHYNPNNNNRSSADKTWYDISSVDVYNCDIATNSNLSNLFDIPGRINNFNLSSGSTVLLTGQNDKKQNGIYIALPNNLFGLSRSSDFDETNNLHPLGKTQYNNRSFELILPQSPYSFGNTSGNTPIIWKQIIYGQTIYASAASTENFSGIALTNSLPDKLDNYSVLDDEKVLLLSQTDNTLRFVARYKKTFEPTLTRVTVGGSGNTNDFDHINCYVLDTNRNKEYELYFNPNEVGVGTSGIYFFERNKISNYNTLDFKTTSAILITSPPQFEGQLAGSSILVKNQINKKENGIYFIDTNDQFFWLNRHENLNESSEISVDKRIFVTEGKNNSGYYGLVFDESGTPSIGNSNIYWASSSLTYNLADCEVATTTNLNLSSLPSSIDGVILESNDRILVKDQTDKTQNGIYLIKDSKNKTWVRDDDLNESVDIRTHLTVKIKRGEDNSGNVYRIKLQTPRALTNTQTTEYILDTDNIEWVEVDPLGLFEKNPSTWQKIGLGSSEGFTVGTSKMNINQISYSNRFGIAIKSPSNSRLAGLGISDNGKIRNLKFKVEYKTRED